MPSVKLIFRCRHSKPQPVRDKQLSASLYRRPFRSQSRLEPAALCQKGSKAATAAIQRLGPFSHASQQSPNEKRKERNGSIEGKDPYSNEVTAPTAGPQGSCSGTHTHQLMKRVEQIKSGVCTVEDKQWEKAISACNGQFMLLEKRF
ncbi:hypothetical protein, unlikely [Trypanosoma congolense IL3000]|uniref:Uncharacterized protein n=1 Tax=Trypanosoma congolense (strain IL3000) TaxID=1068625 RepID=F9W5Z4_TRYCI|nr:hypothetical protein, unlikely [Trypanosoma congolense IL3000]